MSGRPIPCARRHTPEARARLRGVAYDHKTMCRHCWLYANDARYTTSWIEEAPDGAKGVWPARPLLPGDALATLIRELGLRRRGEPRCGRCDEGAKLMNQWGVEGCHARREEILSWLRGEAEALTWLETLKAASRAALGGLAFKLDPFDPAPGILDEALRRCTPSSPSPKSTSPP